jgi:predicted alpha-1,2-mannosidase
LTATAHCGCIRFTFPAGKQANIILPLSYTNTKTISSHVQWIDNQTISGDVTCESFYGKRLGITVYFVMALSKPFASHGTWTNGVQSEGSGTASQDDRQTLIGFYGSYPPSDSPQQIEVRIGVSYVDVAGAKANLAAEMSKGDFDSFHQQTVAEWNKELGVIQVEGGTPTHNRIFYTALYHALLDPLVFDDVDGRYRGFDGQIHHVTAGHRHFYANFSGWDIYRSEIPLLTLIAPERVADMAQSLVDEYKQTGFIDRWSELNQATACMNGNPLTIALVHIWNAGIHHFDMDTAYPAMFGQAQAGTKPLFLWGEEGYNESSGLTIAPDSTVSAPLEHYVAFAALGNLAKSLGKIDDAAYLANRAMDYRSRYNPDSGFLQKKNADGRWDNGFGGYMEGNRFIYLWFVPHDIAGLVDLMGGAPVFERRLDDFFNGKQYDPTNEPDLQAPYLYDYINRPWKTQHVVSETADAMFTDEPGGLAGGGNDDLGTMSAWYVLSQLGFYPVDPGVPYFEVSTPRFNKIVISLEAPYTGKEFVINTPGAAPENEYIQSSILNGKPLTNAWFPETEITGGGTWDVTAAATPNKDRDSSPYDPPYSLSVGFAHQPPNLPLSYILPTSEESPQSWRYTILKPGDDWAAPTFNDSTWQEGNSGFGSGEESVKPRTPWSTDDIWLRRTFSMPADKKHLAIVAYHGRGIEIYLNGILVNKIPVDQTQVGKPSNHIPHSYDFFPVTPEITDGLQPTGNVLAIHVSDPGIGSHFADAGIIQF